MYDPIEDSLLQFLSLFHYVIQLLKVILIE